MWVSNVPSRSYCWFDSRYCCGSPEYVVCKGGDVACSIWIVLVICWCLPLLLLRNIKGCHHWPCCCHVLANSSCHSSCPVCQSRSVEPRIDCYHVSLLLWCNYTWTRYPPTRVHCRVHPCSCNCRFHDWICSYHRHRTSAFIAWNQ